MPSLFLSISSVDWLHEEVSNECRETKNQKPWQSVWPITEDTVRQSCEPMKNSKEMHVMDGKRRKTSETKL